MAKRILKKPNLKKHQNTINIITILFMVIIVLVGIVGISFIFYGGVESRVKALRGSSSLLSNTISNPTDPTTSLEYWLDQGYGYCQILNTNFLGATTFNDTDLEDIAGIERNLRGVSYQSLSFANLVNDLAQDLNTREKTLKESGIEAKGTSVQEVATITEKMVNTTQELKLTIDEIFNSTEVAASGGETEMNNLRILAIELTNQYYKADALVEAAIVALPATDVNILAPFVLISVLNGVFLVFPWILLLLFFLRKRDPLVESKKVSIEKLKLTDEFIKSSEDFKGTLNVDEKDKLIKPEIQKRTFRISEYLVSLILLTIISAAFWYFFFYPYASAGLAHLISSGGGVEAFADYLASDATPIIYGFLGASYFINHMLLRRYFADDLTPRPYSFAVLRILAVFILTAILQLLVSTINSTQIVITVFAFVIGIFPDVGIQYILQWTKNHLPDANIPESINRSPITTLDGLNIWHETRLLEENVENMQNLATVSLDKMIINTNFSVSQLVDWVDQALLSIHTRGLWDGKFHSVGIRTASDLLDNTKSDEKIEKLVKAINDAPPKNLPNEKKSWEAANKDVTEVYKTSESNVAITAEIEKIFKQIDDNNSKIITIMKDLKDKTINLNKSMETQSLTEIKKVESKLSQNKSELAKKSKNSIANIETSLKELKESCNKVKTLADEIDPNKIGTLTKLKDFKNAIDSVCTKATNLNNNITSSIEIAKEGIKDPKTQKEWQSLLSSLKKMDQANETVKIAQKIKNSIETIESSKSEITNKISTLKAKINEIEKNSKANQDKIKKIENNLKDISGDEAIITEFKESVSIATKIIDKYTEIATETKTNVSTLNSDELSSISNMPKVKESIKNLAVTGEQTKEEIKKVQNTLQKAYAPPKITKEIIEVMIKSIKNEVNIKTLTEFINNI